MTPKSGDPVARHYRQAGLAERIVASLRAAGKDPDALTPDDLTPVEEFHVRGRQATAELAALAAPQADDRVLDVGCGIGGPARYLARTYGCRVTGIDLTAEFVRTAELLSRQVGLAERVAFQVADALDLPFDPASFELVWTQHVAMNIGERSRLYGEMARVLVPGGRLAVYDIVQGSGEPLHFPLPWASTPAISHLVTADAMRAHLEAAGLRIAVWRDVTEAGRAWAKERSAQAAGGDPGPLGPELNMGPDWRAKIGNLARDLVEGRLGLIQAVAIRTG